MIKQEKDGRTDSTVRPSTRRERDPWFDNYKAFLIVIVVMSHFMEPLREDFSSVNNWYFFIYSFHMPAFILISGYFSKKTASMMKLVKNIMIPYIVFQLLHYCLYDYVLGYDSELHIFMPHFTLWYLFCLFIWKMITPYLTQIKGILLWTLIVGVTIGLDSTLGTVASASRAIVFYPFFLMGYYFKKEYIERFINSIGCKIAALTILAGYAYFVFAYLKNDDVYNQFLSCRFSYEALEISDAKGMVFRTGFYVLATLLTFCIAILIPKRKHWFTYLGKSTISIYLIHGLLQRYVLEKTDFYDYIRDTGREWLVYVLAIAIVFILSARPIVTLMKKLCNLDLSFILKERSGSRA